ncbi:hypothetical protein GCM10009868_01870 [Terrabacter aerolatus]|uniref:Uncharacterized protein n=1 Tax=Terrabacter aerolatus TaxID=422442 RepID=A0A512D2K5_9MICO|nr:hypothetical protein TAE01_25060 [Terrabacter aerolatus]
MAPDSVEAQKVATGTDLEGPLRAGDFGRPWRPWIDRIFLWRNAAAGAMLDGAPRPTSLPDARPTGVVRGRNTTDALDVMESSSSPSRNQSDRV